MTKVTLGSVSSGTMRTQDLMPVFADLLHDLAENLHHLKLATFAAAICQYYDDDWDDYLCQSIMEELRDALGEYAPPYCYFGRHEGADADFGFWPSEDALRDGIKDREIFEIGPREPNGQEYGLETNDHGNQTLYLYTREEVWSIT